MAVTQTHSKQGAWWSRTFLRWLALPVFLAIVIFGISQTPMCDTKVEVEQPVEALLAPFLPITITEIDTSGLPILSFNISSTADATILLYVGIRQESDTTGAAQVNLLGTPLIGVLVEQNPLKLPYFSPCSVDKPCNGVLQAGVPPGLPPGRWVAIVEIVAIGPQDRRQNISKQSQPFEIPPQVSGEPSMEPMEAVLVFTWK